ncbi:MAG: hypothetical protein IRZ16_02270 [Myxococcaceae bacterium]|nr:hypothetical protein [Myxococcaceae bacterium]
MATGRRFSWMQGGPLFELLPRLRLLDARGRVRGVRLGLALWLPIAVAALVRFAAGRPVDPIVYDLSLHTRLLVAIPMFFWSERLVERATASAVESLRAGTFCDARALDPIFEHAARLRDAWWAEAILAAIALVGGQLALWQITGATGVFHGSTGPIRWSFSRAWFVGFALPVMQFLMFRWLWHWGVWSYVLAKIAALPLDPLATHPDLAGGLACLSRPVSGFAGFAFAISSILAGAFGSKLIAGRLVLEQLLPEITLFLLVTAGVAVAPLLLFSGHLYRARRRALKQYGDFADRYTRAFHNKWIETGADAREALGTPDIQSLSDLGNAYSVVSQTRLFVFGMRSLLAVWAAAIGPMLPLLASQFTVEEMLKRIATAILGGLPL